MHQEVGKVIDLPRIKHICQDVFCAKRAAVQLHHKVYRQNGLGKMSFDGNWQFVNNKRYTT